LGGSGLFVTPFVVTVKNALASFLGDMVYSAPELSGNSHFPLIRD
jgi:hypothetical protein